MNENSDDEMILTQKKRKRSSKGELLQSEPQLQHHPENQSLHLNQQQQPNDNIFNPQDNSIKAKEAKSYSIAASNNCFICLRETKTSNIKYQCNKCFRNFHEECHFFTSKTESQCIFCSFLSDFKCCVCYQLITASDIFITCEFCANKTHFNCQTITIGIILKRNLYSRYYEDNTPPKGRECKIELLTYSIVYLALLQSVKEKEDEIRTRIDQAKFYYQLISDCQEEIGYSEIEGINFAQSFFLVCHFCRSKRSIILKNSLVYQFTNHQSVIYLSGNIANDIHEVLFPFGSCDYNFDKNNGNINSNYKGIVELKSKTTDLRVNYDKSYEFNQIKHLNIKKIIDNYVIDKNTNHSYYLIKWDNNSYSFEYSEFIFFVSKFTLLLDKFKKESMTTFNSFAPCDKHFISQLSSFFNNNSNINIVQSIVDTIGMNRLFLCSMNKDYLLHIRDTIIFPIFNTILSSIVNNTKILICIESFESKRNWKNKFKLAFPDIKFIYINPISALRNILYELIDLNLPSPINHSYFEEIEEKLKKPETILPYLKTIKVNFDSLMSQIVMIQSMTLLNPDIQKILLSFKFNLFYFDITHEGMNDISLLISKLKTSFPINKEAMIYLMSSSNSPHQTLSLMIKGIYDPLSNKQLLNNLNKDIKIQNKVYNKSIMHFCFEDNKEIERNCFVTEYNWAFQFYPFDKTNLCSLNSHLGTVLKHIPVLTIGKNIIVNKAIINFIPVKFDIFHEIIYCDILKRCKNILSSKSPSSFTLSPSKTKNILKLLNGFCSFPSSILIKNNSCSNENHLLKQFALVNNAKLESIAKIIQSMSQFGQRKTIIVYSADSPIDFNSFLVSTITEAIKNKTLQVFAINDSQLKNSLHSNEPCCVFLFNIFLSNQNCFSFLQKLFNTKKLVVFQLFTLNSIEHTLTKMIYSQIDELAVKESKSLFDQISIEHLNKICFEGCPKPKNEKVNEGTDYNSKCNNIKMVLSDDSIGNSDGIMILNSNCLLYGINCNIVFNQIKENDLEKLSYVYLNNQTKFIDNYIENSSMIDNYGDNNAYGYNSSYFSVNEGDKSLPNKDMSSIKNKEDDLKFNSTMLKETKRSTLFSNINPNQNKKEIMINLLDDEIETIPNYANPQSNSNQMTDDKLNHNQLPANATILNPILTVFQQNGISQNDIPSNSNMKNENILSNIEIHTNTYTKSLNDCLTIISSTFKIRNDKIMQLNDILLGKGFTYCVRKSLLLLIINNGINFNEIPAWTIRAQKQINSLYKKQFTLELLRFFIEYFIFSLCYNSNVKNEFLFFSYKPILIKSQLLVIYYNKLNQENLIISILDHNLLKSYHFHTSPQAKDHIQRVMKCILDNCSSQGFNKYENFFDLYNIVKSLNSNQNDNSLTVPILIDIIINDDKYKNSIVELIENLYNELFNRLTLN